MPTAVPTVVPTSEPTAAPTAAPTAEPTAVPTSVPTPIPTTTSTTHQPTVEPTAEPTVEPTSVPVPQPTFSPTKTTCPTRGQECDPDCFRVICRNRRVHYKKCLSKGYEWFEARDYTNPGNLAGCMIHKTRYGVGGCYELECAEHYTQDSCEADNVRAGRGRAVAALSRAVSTVSSPPNGPRRETTPEPRALPSSPEHGYAPTPD